MIFSVSSRRAFDGSARAISGLRELSGASGAFFFLLFLPPRRLFGADSSGFAASASFFSLAAISGRP